MADNENNQSNYYYDRTVREVGKENADAIMRKIAPAGGKASKGGGFATEKKNKNGLTGRQQAKIAGRLGGLKSRRK